MSRYEIKTATKSHSSALTPSRRKNTLTSLTSLVRPSSFGAFEQLNGENKLKPKRTKPFPVSASQLHQFLHDWEKPGYPASRESVNRCIFEQLFTSKCHRVHTVRLSFQMNRFLGTTRVRTQQVVFSLSVRVPTVLKESVYEKIMDFTVPKYASSLNALQENPSSPGVLG